MKKLFLVLCLLASTLSIAFSQEEIKAEEKNVTSQTDYVADMQLALSSPEYPVTSGDIYTLAFFANNTPVTYNISVDASYKIRVANLTVLDAKGKTFLELKRLVEKIVTENYHMSGVQFVLTTPAVFNVTIKGEVGTTLIKQAWALTRLSKIINGSLTPYSSTRNITVTSSAGKKNTYDLFKAQRQGDLSEDPYLRPGDIITINRAARKVTLNGAVERPGTYELLKGENLKTLINLYGGGLTELADTSRVILIRYIADENTGKNPGQTLYLTNKDIDGDYIMNNHDVITISSSTSLAPSIIIEGIISIPGKVTETDETKKEPNTSEKTSVTYLPGTNYADLIRGQEGLFNNYSDLKNAYIERNKERIPINIEDIIYDASFKSKYTPEPNDKLEIPFQQFFTKIHVVGEVASTKEIDAWPLVRLSSIVTGDSLTEFSSTRDVKVTSVDGQVKIYDLFQASRYGNLEQNPYIREGETVEIQRMKRKVTITGMVERPGTYELKDGENIQELINIYGSGLKEKADTSRTRVVRYSQSVNLPGDEMYIAQKDIDSNYALLCYDKVVIPSYIDLMPVVFFEGAIYSKTNEELEASTRVALTFTPGENYATILRSNKDKFSASSDTKNAYIIRQGKQIPIDIDSILYDASIYSPEYVQANDTLLIPFKQYFISVSGAVETPGRYPYIPDRSWDYYIGLAGGFTTQNSLNMVTITDVSGNRHSKDELITPETTIEAKRNSILYYFGQYSPLVTTILSCVTTAISIIAITR